ncbi:MAG: acyl-CoA synthetase [Deltaproteobacteria bacterium]|nr:acyl-CoA synthetase [Deltaproteobacteria bacterium]MBW1817927.1 acyl-CoA synthetase [Deltaproteobacteria bacterium]
MLTKGNTYEEVYQGFKWDIPEYYNIGVDICDKWAKGDSRRALIFHDAKGTTKEYTFDDLKSISNRLANALKAQGIERGDRVGILLPQCPETGLAHIALYKMGAVAVPMFTLFGPDALEYRLNDCEARGIVTDAAGAEKVLDIKDSIPSLETIVVSDEKNVPGSLDFQGLVDKASESFTPVHTMGEDPALIIYTSGTTGPPKGALHAHRVLLAHIPGVEFPHNFFPQPDDRFWTPADWAWAGGLLDVLLPSWHHGVPVVGYRGGKFDPEFAFELISKFKIRNAFMPPTALKMMRQVPNPRDRYDYDMRTIGSGGEPLGEELLSWGREVMGLDINEFYGQTEVNLIVGNCAEVMEIKSGSMGRPMPGHVVEVIDQKGEVVPPGQVGEVAVKRPDPVLFLEYWRKPDATRDKFIGDWCLTGDLAQKDEDGYIWFKGRTDDLITSSGYRIGPSEIEDCLTKHGAVVMAAVIGAPDPVRGDIVKAFIVPAPDVTPGPELEKEIKEFVKTRLSPHEYPRAIEFMEELPLTATGKIMRRELRKREMEKDK